MKIHPLLLEHYEKTLENPDTLGELLRSYAFVGEGLGCYQNFDLRDSFLFITKYHLDDGYTKVRVTESKCKYTGLEVYYYWDGDGYLQFTYEGVTVYNSDCKCTYGWRFKDED